MFGNIEMSEVLHEQLIRRIEESAKFVISDFLLLGDTWNFVEIGGDIPAFEWRHVGFDYEKLFAGVAELQESNIRLAIKLGSVSGCELLLIITSHPSNRCMDINGPPFEVDVDGVISHLKNTFEKIVKESRGDTAVSLELNGPEKMRVFASDWENLGNTFGRRLSSPHFFCDDLYPRGTVAYFAARKIGSLEEWNPAANLSFLFPRLKPQNARRKYVRVALDHILEKHHLWFQEKNVDTDISRSMNVGLLPGCANRYYDQMPGYGPIVALQQSYNLFDDQFADTKFFREPSVAEELLKHLAKKLQTEDDIDRTLDDVEALRTRINGVEKAVEHAFTPNRNHGTRTMLVYVENGSHSWKMADLFINAEAAARNFALRNNILSGHNYNISPLETYVQSLLEISRKLFRTIHAGLQQFKNFVIKPRATEEEKEIDEVSSLISETAADIYMSEAMLCRTFVGKVGSSCQTLEHCLADDRMTAKGLCDWPFRKDLIWLSSKTGTLRTSIEIETLIESVSKIFADYANQAHIFASSCSSSSSAGEDETDQGIYMDMGGCRSSFPNPNVINTHAAFPGLPMQFAPGPPNMLFPSHPLEPQIRIHHATHGSMMTQGGGMIFIRTVEGSLNPAACSSGNTVIIEEVEDNESDYAYEEVTSAMEPSSSASTGSVPKNIQQHVSSAVENTTADDDRDGFISECSSCFSTLFKLGPFRRRKKLEKSPKKVNKSQFWRENCCAERLLSAFRKLVCL